MTENPGERAAQASARPRRREELLERRRAQRRRRRIRRQRALGGLTGVVAVLAVIMAVGVGGSGGRGSHRRGRSVEQATRRIYTRPLELPRGGRTLLPGYLVVAYYGIVGTSNVLGISDDPDADAAGVQRRARSYEGFGQPVQPAFELVATIASPDPGPFGTYSTPIPNGTIARYLRVAHQHRLLLILDFQPGRGEFLPEVERDARFLLDPSVGVALDPEWKLAADEMPDQVIGSSSSASINAVASYLSALVIRHRLPQKLFIVHEFRLSELPDRQYIVRRPGLATVLQMDGLGSIPVKLTSYHLVMRDAEGFYPGFKLFLQPSNDPVLLSPREVMRLRPRPAYISYQ